MRGKKPVAKIVAIDEPAAETAAVPPDWGLSWADAL